MSSARERLVEAIRNIDKLATETVEYYKHPDVGVWREEVRAIVEACAAVADEHLADSRIRGMTITSAGSAIRAALKEAKRDE